MDKITEITKKVLNELQTELAQKESDMARINGAILGVNFLYTRLTDNEQDKTTDVTPIKTKTKSKKKGK